MERVETRKPNKEWYLKGMKKLGELFTRPNVKQKGKDLETLRRGMIRNVMCSGSEREWSKLIRILLVTSV